MSVIVPILEEKEFCDNPAPKSIEFYSSRFGGNSCARCTKCQFVAVYWECGCELEHDCAEYQNN